MDDLKLFGIKIKELRTGRNLSQEQLAQKANISAKYMSRIEMGSQFPSFDVIKKIADSLNVEIKDFFEFAHVAKNTKELKQTIKDLLKEANEENLKLIIKFIRALLR